jgi:hypothetical protein
MGAGGNSESGIRSPACIVIINCYFSALLR